MTGRNKGPSREVSLLLRGSGLNLVGGATQSLAGFLLVLLLTRILGSTTALGAFLTAVAVVNVSAQLGQLGTGTGLVRFVARSKSALNEMDIRAILAIGLWPAFVASTCVAVAVWLLADRVAPYIADPSAEQDVAGYLRWFAVMIPTLAMLTSWANGTRAFGTMRPAVLYANIARPGLQVLGLAALWWLGIGARPVVAAAYWLPYVIAAASLALVLRRLVRARQSERPSSTEPRWQTAASYWRFTAPRAMATVFAAVVEWGDALWIAGLAGTAQAGIYAASTRFLVVGRNVQFAAVNALRPQINRLLDEGRIGAAQRTYRLSATWSVALAWPWFLSVAVYTEELLGILSPEFLVASSALRILCAGWLIGTALGPVSAVLEMAGKSTWSMIDLGLAVAVNMWLNFLLIPRFGLTGAALAWVASILVNNVLPAWQVARATGMTPFGSSTRRVAAAAVAAYGVLWAANESIPGEERSLLFVAVALMSTSTVYLVLLSQFGPEVDVRLLLRRVLNRPAENG